MIRRSTVSVNGLTVCYRHAGSGPPVVLLHEMPRSSIALLPLIQVLAARFTVYAFDMPGHGCSDPLPIDRPDIEEYADALALTLEALQMPRVPVYGTHTGAAVALDLGNRYPERTSAVLLDALALFTERERDSFLRHYLPAFTPDWEGTHMAWLWSRVRDQYSFFPWHLPGTGARLNFAPPPLEQHHRVVLDILRAGDRYRIAYAAAVSYRAFDRLPTCRVPIAAMARDDDLLFTHLDRLPDNFPEKAVIRLGADRVIWASTVADWLSSHATETAPPPAEQSMALRFFHDPQGDILLRREGPAQGQPLVFLHNQPGSSLTARPLTRLIARHRPVYTIDLPGSGESTAGGDTIQRLRAAIDSEGLARFDLAGEFTGAVLAAKLAADMGRRSGVLTLIDAPPDGERLLELCASYPLDLLPFAWDGRHMMTAWHRQRDALMYSPWFDKRRPAMIAMPHAIDLAHLHECTIATLQGAEHEPDACRQLLSDPLGKILARRTQPPIMLPAGDARTVGAGFLDSMAMHFPAPESA
jgi:pimeloyl-ACP methyl ester carboxylesterase